MPQSQRRNGPMQDLNKADLLSHHDRNFAGEWYDGPGGQTFTSAITVNLDTERLNTAPNAFTLLSDIVTVYEAGIHLLHFCVTSSHNSGSSPAVITAWLEEDPATNSFAIVPGTVMYATAHTTGYVSNVGMAILRIGIGYRYRVRVAVASGGDTFVTNSNQSKLSIVRLWKNG